jgi:hypothetical protein
MTKRHIHHLFPHYALKSNPTLRWLYDLPENKVVVTLEEHLNIHKTMWLFHGCLEDKIAWQMLSGHIGLKEASIEMKALHALRTKEAMTLEVRAKMSASLKGRKFTPETRLKISRALLGNTNPLGTRHSSETRAKMGPRKDYRATVETRAKVSAANRARVVSDETRAKIRAIMTGRVVSIETRDIISASNRGKRHSTTTRAKMSAKKMGRPWSAARRLAEDVRISAEGVL